MIDEEMYSNYEVGDMVRVLSGSYEGCDGEIVTIDSNSGEVSLTTILFGRQMLITVSFSEIEKI